MSKPRIKLIPHKEVKDVFLPEFVSFASKELKLSFDDDRFVQGDTFDAIMEEGNQLKFLKTVLLSRENNEVSFAVQSSRDIIKREYERISLFLDVIADDFLAQTLNISAGGMQIRSAQELCEGKVFELEIKYDSKNISVKYEVLRSKKHKNKFFISGKFVDLDKDSKAFIMQQNLKSKMFSLKSLPIRQEGGADA